MTTVKYGTRTFCKDVNFSNGRHLAFAEKRGKVFIRITAEQFALVVEMKERKMKKREMKKREDAV